MLTFKLHAGTLFHTPPFRISLPAMMPFIPHTPPSLPANHDAYLSYTQGGRRTFLRSTSHGLALLEVPAANPPFPPL